MYDKVFIISGRSDAIQSHNGAPRDMPAIFNTVPARGLGIRACRGGYISLSVRDFHVSA